MPLKNAVCDIASPVPIFFLKMNKNYKSTQYKIVSRNISFFHQICVSFEIPKRVLGEL